MRILESCLTATNCLQKLCALLRQSSCRMLHNILTFPNAHELLVPRRTPATPSIIKLTSLILRTPTRHRRWLKLYTFNAIVHRREEEQSALNDDLGEEGRRPKWRIRKHLQFNSVNVFNADVTAVAHNVAVFSQTSLRGTPRVARGFRLSATPLSIRPRSH